MPLPVERGMTARLPKRLVIERMDDFVTAKTHTRSLPDYSSSYLFLQPQRRESNSLPKTDLEKRMPFLANVPKSSKRSKLA